MTEVVLGYECNNCPWEGPFPNIISDSMGEVSNNLYACPVCNSFNLSEIVKDAVKCPECDSYVFQITDFRMDPVQTITTDRLTHLLETIGVEIKCHSCGNIIKKR